MAHTGQEISDATQGRGIPCFPAYNVGQAISSEQVTARGFLRESDMGEGRRLGLPGIPFRFDDTPWPLRMPPHAWDSTPRRSCRRGWDTAARSWPG